MNSNDLNKVILYDSYSKSCNYTNLAGTIGSAAFEMSDAVTFAVSIIFTVVNASSQRHSIDIQTFIPIGIFVDILKYNC